MKIRMLEMRYGSPDGVTLLIYADGQEYDLTATPRERDLAQVFVREGWAEDVEAEPPENKDLGAAPENKAEAPPARRRR